MSELTNAFDLVLRDVVLQSTLIFLVALAIARFAVRRPARVHTVLTLAFLAAIVAPISSEGVRRAGWGVLPPEPSNLQSNVVAVLDSPSMSVPPEPRASIDLPLPSEAVPQMADHSSPANRFHNGVNTTSQMATPAPKIAVETSEPGSSVPSTGTLLAMGVVAWLCASAYLMWRLLLGVIGARRVLRSATPCHEPTVAAALIAARDRLRMNHVNVEVFESSLVRCPMIWCWGRRPKLLLPVDAARNWSAATWTPVLCHELAHWKRRDHWAALVAEIVCCLMPWQVLAWRAKRRLEHASEQACDDWTVAVGHSAVDYAETLLGLVAQADPPLALAALRRRSGLPGRIHHILSQAVPHPRLGRAWVLAVLLIAAMSIGVTAICQRGVVRADAPPAAAADEAKARLDKPASAKTPKPAPIAVGKPEEAMPGNDASTDGAPQTPGVAVDGKAKNLQPKHWKAHGRVTTKDGEPIANADVYWDVSERPAFDGGEWPSPTTRAHAKTDSNGQYVLEADFLQEGLSYQYIVVRAAGYGVRAVTFYDVEKLDEPLEIQMEQSYPIEGTVFSPNGTPVEGARVRVTSLNRQHEPDVKADLQNSWYMSLGRNEMQSDQPRDYWPAPARTGSDGKFELDDVVPHAARIELIIDADEFALTPVFVAGPDATKDPETEYREPGFTLVLENPYVAHGRFLDEKTGEPIPNVRLEVEPGAYGRARFTRQVITTTSDDDGRYTLCFGSADYYSTQVFPPAGYPGVRTSFNSRTIAQMAGSDREFDQEVKLRRGLMLTGRVVDGESGEGVPGAQVHYKLLKGRKIGVNNRFEPVTTDQSGAFEITGVDGQGFLLVDAPRKPFYRLAITDPRLGHYREGIYPHGMVEIDVPKEGQADPFVISLKRGPELAIRALNPEGKPVKQLRAACEESTFDGFFSGQPINDGVFRLNAAEPGRKYRVFLFSEDAMAGAVAEVEAPSDGQPIDIALQPCATIRGRYVYDGGAPAPEVTNFTRFRMYPDQKPEGDAAHNLPFYDNFSGHVHKKRATDNEGYFELDCIIPGAYIYLEVNFNFTNGTRSHEIGILKPGEIKDVGELVIHAR